MSDHPTSDIEESMRDVETRVATLESLVESQQETIRTQQDQIEDQRAMIESLQEALDAATGGAGGVSRRGALQAGGVLGLLGLGAGAASANASGQIGTENRPLDTLHAGTVDTDELRLQETPISDHLDTESVTTENAAITTTLEIPSVESPGDIPAAGEAQIVYVEEDDEGTELEQYAVYRPQIDNWVSLVDGEIITADIPDSGVKHDTDGYLDTGLEASTLNLDPPFTVTLWFRPLPSGSNWFFGNYDGNDRGASIVWDRQGTSELSLYDGEDFHFWDETLNAGSWYHIAVTADGNDYRLYLNGDDRGTVSTGETAFTNTSLPISFGNGYNSGTTKTPGSLISTGEGELNDGRIYNVALSESEVADVMDHEEVRLSDMELWYKMLEGTGGKTDDNSWNIRTGDLVNCSWVDGNTA